ncbi:MAG: hypothetical protein AB2807_00020, partial [Candidatus Sedimenticola endophacoides]
MAKLTFSVVIPCFNCHSTLNQALPSIEAQIYPQECRYLVKDFGTSQSPKSTRQRDSRYCP